MPCGKGKVRKQRVGEKETKKEGSGQVGELAKRKGAT